MLWCYNTIDIIISRVECQRESDIGYRYRGINRAIFEILPRVYPSYFSGYFTIYFFHLLSNNFWHLGWQKEVSRGFFHRELFHVAINRKFTNLLYNVDNLQNFEIRSLGHVITNTIFVPRSDRSDSGGISPPRRIGRHLFNIYWNGSVHWSSKLWKRGVYGGIDSLTDDFSRNQKIFIAW